MTDSIPQSEIMGPPAPEAPVAPSPQGSTAQNGKPTVRTKEGVTLDATQARQQFLTLMDQFPFLKMIMKMLGIDLEGGSPATRTAESHISNVTDRIFTGYDGSPESIVRNLRARLEGMRDRGELKLDSDPARDQREFNTLLGKLDEVVAHARTGSSEYDMATIRRELSEEVEKLDGSFVEGKDLPHLSARTSPGEHLTYGKAVSMPSSTVASLFRGSQETAIISTKLAGLRPPTFPG